MAHTNRTLNPGLVAGGFVLVVVGAILLVAVAWGLVTTDPSIPAAGIPTQQSVLRPPSRLWAIAAGLLMACGAAAVGIGMNRWLRH
jgi:hypothetical protein